MAAWKIHLHELSAESPMQELRAFVEQEGLNVKGSSKAALYEKIVAAASDGSPAKLDTSTDSMASKKETPVKAADDESDESGDEDQMAIKVDPHLVKGGIGAVRPRDFQCVGKDATRDGTIRSSMQNTVYAAVVHIQLMVDNGISMGTGFYCKFQDKHCMYVHGSTYSTHARIVCMHACMQRIVRV